MTRRLFTLGLATAMLMLGGMNARAGSLQPDTPLNTITSPVTVGDLEFSNFTYSAIPVNSPPPASQVLVNPLGPTSSGEAGIQFHAPFFAPAGSTVDYKIIYTVTALGGQISDASLVITGGVFGGTGSVDVGETISWTTPSGGIATRHMDASIPGSVNDAVTFPAQTTINVTKDIILVGGNNGATVSVIDQSFSAIPEPTSMALLGLGLTGLFTFRRFFKRAFVA